MTISDSNRPPPEVADPTRLSRTPVTLGVVVSIQLGALVLVAAVAAIVWAEVSSNRIDVQVIRDDVHREALKTREDLGGLRADTTRLREDVGAIKGDVAEIKTLLRGRP